MDFQDLHTFNMVMIAKQGWKLLHHSDTLVSKILKARYYQSRNFLNTHVGVDPSFTWHSILEVRALLLQGITWRVGTNSFIDIRNDPWLPSIAGFKIRDPQVIPLIYQSVSQLLLPNLVWWNIDLTFSIFSQRDAEPILELPLTQSLQDDILFWQPESKGNFSVKTAYKLAWRNHIKAKIQVQAPGYQIYSTLQQSASWWRCL